MAAEDTRARSSRRQLPITECAHKAGIVGDAGRPAVVALLDMAAQRRGPARRDRAHDAPLDMTEMVAMRSPKRLAVAAENVRRLDPRVHDAGSGGRHDLQPETVERARRLADGPGRNPSIARRALQIGVTEQNLDDADVGPVLQQMGGEAVAAMSQAT